LSEHTGSNDDWQFDSGFGPFDAAKLKASKIQKKRSLAAKIEARHQNFEPAQMNREVPCDEQKFFSKSNVVILLIVHNIVILPYITKKYLTYVPSNIFVR
jgi:hypothetical protein